MDPYALAREAAAVLRDRTGGGDHDVALVMGSGWLPAADALGATEYEIATDELPGFSAPAVAGHGGTIRSVRVGDLRALVFLGRTHYYEGRGVAAVVHGVRTAAAAGVRSIVLTNGCGGLDPAWTPGTPVLISDHINLTATSPIVGANFVDLTDLYSRRLRELVRDVDPSIDEGVYVQFPGPHYETPAEVRMAGILGGTLVGMSTTLEAIAAREAGMEVLGISLVTNLAAGISDQPLNHEEVLEAGQAAATRMGALLAEVLPGSDRRYGEVMDAHAAALDWISQDPDPVTRAELTALVDSGDEAAVAARFAGRLEFGTAGLRGEIGAGPLRMNRVVVARAAAGLATYLRRFDPDPSVVVGYDARTNSEIFARDTAEIMQAAGVRAMLLPEHLPTPVLAFAIGHLGASAA